MGKREQSEAIYEPPMLVEVGDFAQLTCGFGSAELDAFDYFSNFFAEW